MDNGYAVRSVMLAIRFGHYESNILNNMRFFSILAFFFAAICANQAFAGDDHSIVSVKLAHLRSGCTGSAPATFGQPFRKGDVPDGARLVVHDGANTLPTQTDVKARNSDGSVRHAIITVAAPCSVDRNDNLMLTTSSSKDSSPAIGLSDVLASSFDDGASFKIDGASWHLNARDVLAEISRAGGCGHSSNRYCKHWLDGPLVGEWVVGAPPVNASGEPNPDLMVFFAVRAFGPAPVKTVRVDTIIENDWAYAQDPHNLEYSARITVPGQPSYQVQALTHYSHARWHHVSWWGEYDAQPWFAALNGQYLQATPAVPKYQNIALSNEALSKVRQNCAPMAHCDVMRHMEATGAQPQIGPLPQWSSAYVINPHDYRAYRWMLANSDALGSYSTHYRSQNTRRVLSIAQHPCATLLRRVETKHCAVPPHDDDRFPRCQHNCHLSLQAEPAHHGAPAYVAYLATGDWYYEQELNFWADWVLLYQNQGYRGYRKGLVHTEQVRAQAWSLRTLADTAYILPDDASSKEFFNQSVSHNITWYNKHYAENREANSLGFLTNGYAVTYGSGEHRHTGIAPWQLSFFSWATGNLADMGFEGADRMRNYFSQFQIGLMTSPGFCPEMASTYYLRVRDTPDSGYYSNFSKVYDNTFPELVSAGCEPDKLVDALRRSSSYGDFDYPAGTMVGYPKSDTGFVANFQIGLAAAVGSGRDGAADAWSWFINRPVRPNYQNSPQFAVVPSVDPSRGH